MLDLAEQEDLMGDGQVDEFLVVNVALGAAGLGWRSQPGGLTHRYSPLINTIIMVIMMITQRSIQ